MKKRFLFLLLGVNLLLISSISVSVAWFLGSLNLFIENIDITVDVDADLKIAAENNIEYAKDSLTSYDFGRVEDLMPITSMCSEHSEWINDASTARPTFYAQYKTGNRADPAKIVAQKGYFQRVFYLFSTHHMLATFDSSKTFVRPNKALNEQKAAEKATSKSMLNFKAIADKEIEANNITDEDAKTNTYNRVREELYDEYYQSTLASLNKIEDSLRISILDYENLTNSNYTIIDPKKTEDPVVFGGRLSTSISKDYFDFYPDYETGELKECLFGDIKGKPKHDLVYRDPAIEDVPAEGTHTCFNAGTRKGVKALDTDDLKTNVTFYEEQSIDYKTADVSTHPDNLDEGYLVELFPNVAHPFVLTVYLEGWDRDNVDATQEASFDMSIHFRQLGPEIIHDR
jgi:hypothetical protein